MCPQSTGNNPHTSSPDSTSERYAIATPLGEGGSLGVKVDIYRDGKAVAHHLLPGIVGRYHKGDGVIYMVAPAPGLLLPMPGEDAEVPTKWGKVSHAARVAMKDPLVAAEWFKLADSWTLTSPSPTVFEGVPPLAPDLVPATADETQAREAWGWLGRNLAPMGRFVVGLTLASPWMRRMSGTSMLVHLVGSGGSGKSVLAQVAAAVYGDPEEGVGLYSNFNATGQGMTASAQDLSYFPVIRDEVEGADDLEGQMKALLNGAQRQRSNRAGSAVRNPARWYGLVLTTGNDPLGFTKELFDRRLLEIDSSLLWGTAPVVGVDGATAQDRQDYWTSVIDMTRTVYGAPWAVLSRQYHPGPRQGDETCAEDLPEVIKGAVPMPGESSLGVMGQVGTWGAMWLASWTGEQAWALGVHETAALAIAERSERRRDVVSETAQAVVVSMVEDAPLWTADVSIRGRIGHPDTAVTGQCRVEHAGQCRWFDVAVKTFKERFAPTTYDRLLKEGMRAALHVGADGKSARKIRDGSGARPYYLTFCEGAMNELATPGSTLRRASEAMVAAAAPTLPLPLAPEPAPLTPAPAPVPAPVTEEHSQVRQHVVGWVREDTTEALDAAVEAGCTDVVGSSHWVQVQIAGYHFGGSQTIKHSVPSLMLTRDSDGRQVRVWQAMRGQTPEETCQALTEFLPRMPGRTKGDGKRARPGYTGSLSLVSALLQSPECLGKSRRPIFQIDQTGDTRQGDAWYSEAVAHPAGWGVRKVHDENGKLVYGDDGMPIPLDLDQWDRNNAYLVVIGNANLAPLWRGRDGEEPERWTHYTETTDFDLDAADAPVDPSHFAGMYRVTIPDWSAEAGRFAHLPGPWGTVPPGRVLWTSPETVAFAREHGVNVTIHEAWLAPRHNVTTVGKTAARLRSMMDELEGSPARVIPKAAYQAFAGTLMIEGDPKRDEQGHVVKREDDSIVREGGARGAHGKVYRPDWAAAITDRSYVSVLRVVYNAWEADERFVPEAINVDAIYYPPGLGTPPGMKVGTAPGEFKFVPRKEG